VKDAEFPILVTLVPGTAALPVALKDAGIAGFQYYKTKGAVL
jgi:hypothetical protein